MVAEFTRKPEREAGGWRLEAGGWRLEAGGWRLEAGASVGWMSLSTSTVPPLVGSVKRDPTYNR